MGFENFPYTNFHELNLDWIAKIAKDFLEQYTHIQELIANGEQSLQDLTASGLTDLQAKADELKRLLDEWYNTHSEDIANQLTASLAEMVSATNANKVILAEYTADLISSLPADYTEALARLNLLTFAYDKYVGGRMLFNPAMIDSREGRLNASGDIYETEGYRTSLFIPVAPNTTYLCNFTMSTLEPVALYSSNNVSAFISRIVSGTQFTTPANANFIRFSMETANLNKNNIYTDAKLERFEARTNEEIDILFNLTGYTSFSPLNIEVADGDSPIAIAPEMQFTTRNININGQIAINTTRDYRLYYIFKLKTNHIPTGVSLNGIYLDNEKLSTNIISSYSIKDSYVWVGYLDVDSNTPTNAILALSITTSQPSIVTIEKFELLSDTQTNNIEYLEVGSGKTYSSLTSAFNYARQQPLNSFIVRLYGWYEMNANTDDLSTDSGNQGLAVPYNVIKIIGNDRRDTNVINFVGTTLQAALYLLHSVTIENIYFITKSKYAIIIDDGRNIEQTFTIRGNKFKHISGGSGAIGIGTHNCEINILENMFEQSTDSGVRAHNWDYGNSFNQHLNIIGNYFTNNMVYAIHLFTVNRRNGMGYARAIINENYFSDRTIMLSEEDSNVYGIGNLWEVWGHNNSETSVEIMHHDTADHSGLVNIFMPRAIVTDTKIQ